MRKQYEAFLKYIQRDKHLQNHLKGWYKDTDNRYTTTNGKVLAVIKYELFSFVEDKTNINEIGEEIEIGSTFARNWRDVVPVNFTRRFKLNLSGFKTSWNYKHDKTYAIVELFPELFISAEYLELLKGYDWQCANNVSTSPILCLCEQLSVMLVIMPMKVDLNDKMSPKPRYVSLVSFADEIPMSVESKDEFKEVLEKWLG